MHTGLVAGAIVAVAGSIGLVTAMSTLLENAGQGPVEAAKAGQWLRLTADPHIDPGSVVPGATFRYSFELANTGSERVRGVVAHSNRITGKDNSALQVLAVSDPACHPGQSLSCHFPILEPGDRRRVRVTARAPMTGTPGQTLVVDTYLAAAAPRPLSRLLYDVISPTRTTTGTFTRR